jgi:hypothetical protein
LLARLTPRQTRRAELEDQLAALPTITAPLVTADLERRLREKLADWRGLLLANIDSARDVLRTLLVEPLRFTPVPTQHGFGYAFEGKIALNRLIADVIDAKTLTGVASPTGFANMWKRKLAGILRRPPRWSRLRMA